MTTWALGIASADASVATSSELAAPSTGGAARDTTRAPPRTPPIALFRACGFAATWKRTAPEEVVERARSLAGPSEGRGGAYYFRGRQMNHAWLLASPRLQGTGENVVSSTMKRDSRRARSAFQLNPLWG